MDSEKRTEFLNYFINKEKSILRESIIYHPRNVTMRRRILGDNSSGDHYNVILSVQ